MRVRPHLVFAFVSLGVLAAGCTVTSAGTPSPGATQPAGTSTESSSSSGEPAPQPNDELPSDGAPGVEDPMDVTQFEQDPCRALTAAQARELNVPTTGKATEIAFGKGCTWMNTDSGGQTTIQFFSSDERGLSSIYREAKGSDFEYFEPIDDIEGYPAVEYNIDEENPDTDCTVAVGVTDRLAFTNTTWLSSNNVGHDEPCDVAVRVTTMMMKTMQGEA